MDAVEYLKVRERHWKDGCVDITYALEKKRPEDAVRTAEMWAESHPVKTMRDDFFEKFPNAFMESDGTPGFCPSAFYGVNGLCVGTGVGKCVECWNRPLEEEK